MERPVALAAARTAREGAVGLPSVLVDAGWRASCWVGRHGLPAIVAAVLVGAAAVVLGWLPGGTPGLVAGLLVALAVAVVVYDARRSRARNRLSSMRVVPASDDPASRAREAELVAIAEEQLAVSGLPVPTTSGGSPLPRLGPVLAATSDARLSVLGALIDRVADLVTPPTGHELALAALPPDAEGRDRVAMRLTDLGSGLVDESAVLTGTQTPGSAARRAAFRAYVHATNHACGRGRLGPASSWGSAEDVARWVELRETGDAAEVRELARSEPGNAPVRLRLAQLVRETQWAESVECLLEIVEAGDGEVLPDALHRLAIVVARRPEELGREWAGLPADVRGRLWRRLWAAVGSPSDSGNEGIARSEGVASAVDGLLDVAARAAERVARWPARHAGRRTAQQLATMRASARSLAAIALIGRLEAAEGDPDDGPVPPGTALRGEPATAEAARLAEWARPVRVDRLGWQARYNAACLVCRSGGPLAEAMGHVMAVVTDPDWRRAGPAIVEERRRWLLAGDPDLARLRSERDPAADDFRHLRARLLPGVVEVHVASAAAAGR